MSCCGGGVSVGGKFTTDRFGEFYNVPSTYQGAYVPSRGAFLGKAGCITTPCNGCIYDPYQKDSTVDDLLPEEGQLANAKACACCRGQLACNPAACNKCADNTIVQREAFYDPRGCGPATCCGVPVPSATRPVNCGRGCGCAGGHY